MAAKGGMMQQQNMMPSGSDNAVFSRGRATSGDAYLAACVPVAAARRPRARDNAAARPAHHACSDTRAPLLRAPTTCALAGRV
jgi:phosphate starvation-inducible protein PhoH